MKSIVKQSIFAGILIGLSATGYLALGGLPGAIIFTFGLVGVVLSGSPLYTGRAGEMTDMGQLLVISLFNILPCIVIGLLVNYLGGEPASRAKDMVAARLSGAPMAAFIKAVGCGLIIDLSCSLYRNSKNLTPIIFGVPLFIVCGFYHSIADVVYLFANASWDNAILWYYPIIFVGNFVGCNVRRVLNMI